MTCFGIVPENSYNGPAVVDNVYLMTCETWKGFDLPCLICVKIKLVEVDSSIQRRCLDGVCFLLRSAFPASSHARVLGLPRTGKGRPGRDDGANDPRGARTVIEPERLMNPSLKRGSKKYARAGARGEHKRTVSATCGSWKWARSVRSLSFYRRSITIVSIIRKEEGKKQEARRNVGLMDMIRTEIRDASVDMELNATSRDDPNLVLRYKLSMHSCRQAGPRGIEPPLRLGLFPWT